MNRRQLITFAFLVGLALTSVLTLGTAWPLTSTVGEEAASTIPSQLHRQPSEGPPLALPDLPLRFIANAGQTDSRVRFTLKGAGHTIFFTEEEVVFNAVQEVRGELDHSVVRLSFAGTDSGPGTRLGQRRTVQGLAPMPGAASFFIGDDPVHWQTNVPTYGAVAYRELYPGVDLIYRGTQGHLKSEFRLAPGADPSAIQMVYSGLESLHLREDGSLVLETRLGELNETAPLIYQEIDGVRQEVPGGYVLLSAPQGEDEGSYRVGFRVGGHDPTHPLVIDPVLGYASYLGGSSLDQGHGIALDDAGSIYATGLTYSSDFITTTKAIQPSFGGGNYDAYVTQIISASGSYTYGTSTYLGGDGSDQGYAVAVPPGSVDNVVVVGWTSSSNFPTTANALDSTQGSSAEDAFVVHIVSAGGVYTLAYASYLGGSGQEFGWDVAVKSGEDIYVAGQTSSTDFPAAQAVQPAWGGSYDAFVTHIISATGAYTYAYSTYLGGDGSDYAKGIVLGNAGDVYVTGGTHSDNFPITPDAIQPGYGGGNLDAFVTHIISASGVYTYGTSTFLGGSGYDYGWGVALPTSGTSPVFVTGYTDSDDFPTRHPIQTHQGAQDIFVTQIITASGTYTYGFSTYLGGSGSDFGPAFALDSTGAIYVTGRTRSSDFPIRCPIRATLASTDSYDVFVTQIISASGAYGVGYSTYLGGSQDDIGRDIAVDSAGNVYVTGETDSSDFPVRHPIQTDQGSTDAFVAKLLPTCHWIHLPLILRAYP